MKRSTAILIYAALATGALANPALTKPIASGDLVFEEVDGLVAVEAEHFFKQEKSDVRAWYLTTGEKFAGLKPDHDPNHSASASGGAYLEILPDTRKNHSEKLIKGENFINEPGKMAVLSYRVYFNNPGKYYVWCRVYPTGTEDNGLHVGIDGTWPESGQRLQFGGKKRWMWDSRQRTEKVHTGVRGLIFLDVETAGEHTISFSMREDGFEFDQWLMTTDKDFHAPGGDAAIPASKAKSGTVPLAFKVVAASTRPAPEQAVAAMREPGMLVADFSQREDLYLDKDKWFAVNPDQHKSGRAVGAWPFRAGTFDLTLHAVGENDGESSYTVSIEGETIGEFICPLADDTYAEGAKFTKTFKDVLIPGEKAMVEVVSKIGSRDGEEFSRARWSRISVKAADGKPLQARASTPVAKVTAPQPKVSFSGDLYGERGPDGDGSVEVTGELKAWHKVTLTMDGRFAHEKDNKPNPFTDRRATVTFEHESGSPSYSVPGYFAADGNAGETSAESGTKWRAHLSPDKPGKWRYSFVLRPLADGEPIAENTLITEGSFTISPSDKTGRDLRGKGRLQYVNNHHLQFAGNKEWFVKAGADAPETFLGYADFDGTRANKPGKVPLKTWGPHIKDWRAGDPTWKGGRGKGMIGAINYLSGKGCNVFSFMPYNAGGDGDNVWPFVSRDDKLHYDCSKLDQWGIVFDHATTQGLYLHFKLQETENDDDRLGASRRNGHLPASLDGGKLGPERKLYLREIIARFGHALALNWNIGEECSLSPDEIHDMIQFIHQTDPYQHPIVLHTFPPEQELMHRPLLGSNTYLSGVSLQNPWDSVHQRTLQWRKESAEAGRPWVVANDEQNPAGMGVPPDPGYEGHSGIAKGRGKPQGTQAEGYYESDAYTLHDIRKLTLWGNLMAGGAGVEYYFGYSLPQNDLVAQDFRRSDKSWDYCRIALDFFRNEKIPFAEMSSANALIGNPENENTRFCFAKPGEIYLVYLPNGGEATLDLSNASGDFSLRWFNPRDGSWEESSTTVKAGAAAKLSAPDKEDWLAVIRKI